MKNIFIITILILLCSCKKNNTELISANTKKDTIVMKNVRKVLNDTAFRVQIVKSGEYIVYLKKQQYKSWIQHAISRSKANNNTNRIIGVLQVDRSVKTRQ